MSKNKTEEFVDAILGSGDDLDDELATSILSLHLIDEDVLTVEFKARLTSRLAELPDNSKEAHNLRRTLSKVIEQEKQESPDFAKPKDYIGDLMRDMVAVFPKPIYSFHKRADGDMPSNDKNILDEPEEELGDESE